MHGDVMVVQRLPDMHGWCVVWQGVLWHVLHTCFGRPASGRAPCLCLLEQVYSLPSPEADQFWRQGFCRASRVTLVVDSWVVWPQLVLVECCVH
jgi:hypothetical protein